MNALAKRCCRGRGFFGPPLQTATAANGDFTNGLRVIMSTGSSNLAGSKATVQFVLNQFIASHTGDSVLGTQAALQPASHRYQEFITNKVAKTIIHNLELVHIYEQDRKLVI